MSNGSHIVSTLGVGLFTECYRPIQNGIVASLDALAHVLRGAGHAATIVTPEMPGYRDVECDVVRLRSLPLPTHTAYRLTVPYLPRRSPAFAIVHAHSPFVTGWLALREARRARVPLVFTYHTQLEAYAHYVPFEAHLTRGAAARLTRAYANAADAVIVPTYAMERRLREIGVRARIAVVPSGIDVAQFASGRRRDDLRARLGVAPSQKMVLCVGRLGREKNVERALESFARLGDSRARLVLIGDGPHRAALERSAKRFGIAARTTFAREFARPALPDAYASADAFLFTSHSETQGLVLAEALAAGTPVVAVDTAQTREVLGAAGRIVRDDAAALAVALRDVLDGSPPASGRAAAIAEAGRFDRRVLGARVLAVYESLLPVAAARTTRLDLDIEHTFDLS
jgi:glycosyltransferase involved in cell wall biosynthesis